MPTRLLCPLAVEGAPYEKFLLSLTNEVNKLRRAGEHGTGRNVAPFVEAEWGSKAYELMWELKDLFDPDQALNPGVLLNRDPDAHRKFFKPSPEASEIVNRCRACLLISL